MAKETEKIVDPSVASVVANSKLEHSQGGATTRDDALDLGVPMLQGDGSEPVGPEDALGIGPKRGDYTNRLGGSTYNPHQVVPVTDAKPGEATARVEAQSPRAEDIGEVAGKKGGVDSASK
jgi:hypothetical protein